MGNKSKLPLFINNELCTLYHVKIRDRSIEARLSVVESAVRPEGFRYSKFICTAIAETEGFSAKGAGESHVSATNAFEKAKSEAIERLCLKIYCDRTNQSFTSNGWAAHTTSYQAKTNAALELIERDAVLVHWLKATSFIEIDPAALPLNLQWWRLTELRKSEFPILRLFLTVDGYYPSIVAILQNQDGHGVTGTASGLTLMDAVRSAVTEACRAAHHYLRKSYDTANLDECLPGLHSVMYSENDPLPKWFLEPDSKINWNSAKKLFSQKALDLAILKSNINFQIVAISDLVVVQASSKNLQSVFWGPSTQKDVLNLERINTKNINLLPHIVG